MMCFPFAVLSELTKDVPRIKIHAFDKLSMTVRLRISGTMDMQPHMCWKEVLVTRISPTLD